jgi:ADP-ribose pyrophosphatase YjhB (NUDIX family)
MTGPVRDRFCSSCGTEFPDVSRYPRTCPNVSCGRQVWANPIPVSVVLVPVAHEGRVGLLVVRRAIPPQLGKLALVGGFLEEHESWQEGGAREIREETGVEVDANRLCPAWYVSTEPRPNRVLLFSVAPTLDSASLPPARENHETSERGLVFGPDGLGEVFAFPLHVRAAERFFAERGIEGSHDFVRV